ncbi:MAG: hypothetical protein DRJ60_03985 [Thermoprotei archaeon]|nr:MAG: hypothetical protein DRJ60_03985 [Thermoprotei archaeon]
MILSKLDAAIYPFTSLAAKIVEELEANLGIDSILSSDSEILHRSIERIREAIYSRITSVYKKDLDVEILSHPVALLLIKAINNTKLFNLYAEAEKNRVFFNMVNEEVDKILFLAIDGFKWHLKKDGDNILLRFDEYLRASISILDPYWKLVNRKLRGGYVEVTKRDLCRLIAEAYRERIIEKVNKRDEIYVPDRIKPIIEELNKEIEAVLPKVEVTASISISEYNPSAFPPCILKLLEEANEGKNLPHMARFTLATFLISVGKRPEEIIDIFRKLPDFDENKTMYHLRHVAGEIGSRIRYIPPSCATLRTFNLCPSGDELCLKVKHPLTYYSHKLRLMRKMRHEKRAKQ